MLLQGLIDFVQHHHPMSLQQVFFLKGIECKYMIFSTKHQENFVNSQKICTFAAIFY